MATEDNRIIPVTEVAKALHVSHRRVIMMILNGTLPIGGVAEPDDDFGHYSVAISRERFEKWMRGELIT